MNPILLPENIVFLINIALIAMFVVLALIGYIRGFISQLYDLLVMGIGYLFSLLIAPSLANAVRLLPKSVNLDEVPFVGAQLVVLIDRLLWTIIIVFIFIIIGLIFKGMVIKKVLHYQKKVLPDRIGGAVFAILPVGLIGFAIAVVLSAPIFSNGTQLLSATVLSPLSGASGAVVQDVIEQNPALQLLDKFNSGDELDETDFEAIRLTLVTMGFPENVIDVAMKFVKHEEVTEADIEILKTYAQDHNVTPETVRGWLQDFGFSEAQINELMEQYGQP